MSDKIAAQLHGPRKGRPAGPTAHTGLWPGAIGWWRDLPAHVLLLPAALIVHLFWLNHHRIALGQFLFTLAGIVAGYLAVREVLRWFLPSAPWRDQALAASFLVMGMRTPLGFARVQDSVWVLLCLIAFGVFIARPALRRQTAFALTCLATLAVALPAASIAASPVWRQRPTLRAQFEAGYPPLPAAGDSNRPSPDLYYLVLDRYARADQLLVRYDFDNAAFLDRLRSSGFLVADGAYANYPRTAHSLVSTLNLDYLPSMPERVSASSDWMPIYEHLDDTRLASFLRESGYEFHFLGTWWDPTRTNTHADRSYNRRALPGLLRLAFDTSLVGALARRFEDSTFNERRLQCEREKFKFRVLQDMARAEGADTPKFVFAHFLVPHPPFVVDAAGRCLSVADAMSRGRRLNYIEQIAFANDRVLSVVEAILARPGPPPIIVIQSDEGPWPASLARDEVTVLGRDVTDPDWTKVAPALLREKMAILSAMYLPGSGVDGLAPSFTPVNTFRVVLREYFGVPLDDLPNRSFVFQDDSHLYEFHEVTDVLHAGDRSRSTEER